MEIPIEFNNLCRNFHQDVMLIHSTPENMISSAVRSLNEKQKKTVRRFLDELLDGRYEPAEIKKIWWESAAEIHFQKEKELFAFLRLIRDTLG
jgi:hypothetical protein